MTKTLDCVKMSWMAPHITQEKIQKLLEELRSWEPGEVRLSLLELSERYSLDTSVVEELAASEGVRFGDPEASTVDLDPDEIRKAIQSPESDSRYEDRDTGIWRRKPTGEWELVEPG